MPVNDGQPGSGYQPANRGSYNIQAQAEAAARKNPPRNPNGTVKYTTGFSEAYKLLEEGFYVTSPCSMVKDSYIYLTHDNGIKVIKMGYIDDGERKLQTITNLPTALILAYDWRIVFLGK